MSGGSSCSQTPSRAIPATRRVVLSDGVQLPPGDYSTTPGGTLFSTTPGGRGVSEAPGAGGGEDGLGRSGGSASPIEPGGQVQGRGDWEELVKRFREAARVTEVATGRERAGGRLTMPALWARPPAPGCKPPHSFPYGLRDS